jgi:type VI secretion system protein ImpH
MASSDWGTDRRLDESLFAAACEFDFFQAVRLLTLLHGERHPEVASGPPPDVVRFRAHNSLAFPASPIASIKQENGDPPDMTVTFLGMTGPEGALPAAYTEIAVDRECFGDTSLAEFLDIFNHRLISLFFQAWKKHHFVVGYEQTRRRKLEQDEFTSYLFDLIGMGTAGLRGRMPVADLGLLHYAGLLSQRPHSAEALRALLHDYFEVPVKVEQFLGKWHVLEKDELCCMGSNQASSQLGGGAVAGDAVWSRQALVRVVFGPLTAERFRSFLPDGNCFSEAAALTRWFLGSALEFELQPTLRGDEVPECSPGGTTLGGPRLGWSAWLSTEPFAAPAADAMFREEEQAKLEA